jgi:hypothetical protein
MILRDLTKDDWTRLVEYEGDRVHGVWYHGYIIHLTPRKYLAIQRLRDISHPWRYDKNGNSVLDLDVSVPLWDVIGFFQSSFLQALQNWLPQSPEVTALLEKGKGLRGSFTWDDINFVREYNAMELECLVKLMKALTAQLKQPEIDLTLTRWDGAGAIATALFRKHETKSHIKPLHPNIELAARHAFFGGRFEAIKYGSHLGDVYDYDLCSAYPSAITQLPSLADSMGFWRHYDKGNVDITNLPDFSLVHITWDFRSKKYARVPFFPFPYRAKAEGRILYPPCGRGWYWAPEVIAAMKHGFSVDIKEVFSFHGAVMPFGWVRDYYALRQRWITESRAGLNKPNGEKVIKLGLNSLYGKMAQHVGYDQETHKIPPYHSLAYAGFITALTRARLFDAAMTNPGSVVFFATDGIFSTAPLDVPVTNTKELGEWEMTKCDELINIESGVYFYRIGDHWACRLRGFDKPRTQEQISRYIDMIRDGWRRKEDVVYLPCTRFIGHKAALVSNDWWKRHCSWYSFSTNGHSGRALSLLPGIGKRIMPFTKYPSDLHKRMIDTLPEIAAECHYEKHPKNFPISEPYEVGWGIEIAWLNSPEGVMDKLALDSIYDEEDSL